MALDISLAGMQYMQPTELQLRLHFGLACSFHVPACLSLRAACGLPLTPPPPPPSPPFAGKVRTPATKTLYSVLRCNDMAFLDLLDACLRWVGEQRGVESGPGELTRYPDQEQCKVPSSPPGRAHGPCYLCWQGELGEWRLQ
jgi:hypothetical protein